MKSGTAALFLCILSTAYSYGQVSTSGSVTDDSGVALPGATVEILQIPILPKRPTVPGPTPTPPITPGFDAELTAGAGGSFNFNNVPPGTYSVCAYSSAPGLLSNCDWKSHYVSVNVGAGGPVQLPTLIMVRGTVITFAVHDTNSLLSNGSHYIHPGVITDDGRYSSAQLTSSTAATRTYSVTIPKTDTVHVFIDSDLSVTDSSGAAFQLRAPSSTLIQGGSDVTVDLFVQ